MTARVGAMAVVLAVAAACDGAASSPPARPTSPAPGPPPAAPDDPGEAVPAPPDPPPPDDSPVEVLPAWGAITHEGTLFVLSDDLLTITAVELSTRRRRFATRFQEAPSGGHELAMLRGDRLLVHAGGTLHVLDAATGARVGRHAGPMNGVGRQDRAHLWRRPGICAIRTECQLQVVDCDDARPLGEPLRGTWVRRYPRVPVPGVGRHTTSCRGLNAMLLGRAGSLLIVGGGHSAPGDPSGGALALDARTGAPRWSAPDVGCRTCAEEASGISPDGATCWLGGTDGELRVFECATGRARFSEPGVRVAAWAGDPGGIFVLHDAQIRLLDPSTGRARWRRAIPAGTTWLPAGARGVDLPPGPDPLTVGIVAPASGETLATGEVPAGHAVTSTDDGALLVAGLGRGWGADGRPTSAPVAAPVATVERGAPSVIRDARGQAIASFDTDSWIVGEHRGSDGAVLAVYVSRTEGPGAVHLLGVER